MRARGHSNKWRLWRQNASDAYTLPRIHVPPSRVEPHRHIVWRGLHEWVQGAQRACFSRMGLHRSHHFCVLQQEIRFCR